MKKKILLIYIILFFVVISIPSVGMLWNKTTTSKEKKKLASFPSLIKDGSFNQKVFDEFDDYLADHFAYKEKLVTANAILRSAIFNESAENQVIKGKDGYLFFRTGVENYQGEDVLTNRQVFNATQSLKLIQEYCDSNGIKFAFTIAPNKATLYPNYLPDRYFKRINTNNSLEKLTSSLKENNINYVDLVSAFKNNDEVLYHKLDSHWNNKGAVLANNTILDYLNKPHDDYSDTAYTIKEDYSGDLYDMLYPSGTKKDKQIYYDYNQEFTIDSENNSFEDNFVKTTNPSKEGTVMVFRDSYGNSWSQFVAQEYNKGYFSRESGYNISYLNEYQCDTLIIEITERHLSSLQQYPPILSAPIREISETPKTVKNDVTMETYDFGNYIKVAGSLDKNYTDSNSKVYIKVNDNDKFFFVEATPSSFANGNKETSYGYCAYIAKMLISSNNPTFEVITQKNSDFISSGIVSNYKK
ncbi:MAG: hypothetical protein SOY42_10990 [Clostridium sp.]|nr:hypothetical protein [Clostridium sp.]